MRWLGRKKISKSERPEAPEEEQSAAAADTSAEEILAALRAHLIETADGKLDDVPIDSSAPLLDYGYVDSLTAVSLLERIKADYGLEIAETELVGRLTTLDAITRHIVDHRSG